MLNPQKQRLQKAKNILERCIGGRGLCAGTDRYDKDNGSKQYWTRDLVFAGMDALFLLNKGNVVRRHLLMIARHQKRSGQVPIMITEDPLRFLLAARKDANANRERFKAQIRMFRQWDHLWNFRLGNLTPWTHDGEILFVWGCLKYFEHTNDVAFWYSVAVNVRKAMRYVETHLMRDSLLYGGDWRDVMVHLGHTAVLSNNAILYHVYKLLGQMKKAEALHARIDAELWTGSYYRDRTGSEEFDILGQALAVEFGMMPPEYYASVIEKYQELDSAYGYTMNTNVPPSTNEPLVQAFTDQYQVIWPGFNRHVYTSLTMMGRTDLAIQQFKKWSTLFEGPNKTGFAEWCNPQTGEAFGGKEQMWSAAAYILTSQDLLENAVFHAQLGLTMRDYMDVIPIYDRTLK